LLFRRPRQFSRHIRPGETYVGDLTADDDIRIDGIVRGRITTPRKVVIGPDARAEGALRASEVVVAGELIGTVEASARFHVLEGARVLADATAGTILIEDGADCRGTVRLRSRRPDGRVEEVVCHLPGKRLRADTRLTGAPPKDVSAS